MINKIGSDRTGASVLGPKKKSSGSDRISDQNRTDVAQDNIQQHDIEVCYDVK
jgi:hypothetical protein